MLEISGAEDVQIESESMTAVLPISQNDNVSESVQALFPKGNDQ